MKHSSANLPRKQPRLLPADGAAHMTSLPASHYYGFMYCTPRMEMRSFNPSNPSSLSMASPQVSSPSSSGMMIPVAEQPLMVGNFPVTRTRVGCFNYYALMIVQTSLERYQEQTRKKTILISENWGSQPIGNFLNRIDLTVPTILRTQKRIQGIKRKNFFSSSA